MKTTGFIWDEKYMWHDAGNALGVLPVSGDFQPWVHFENSETKRRLKNLMDAYGFTAKLDGIEQLFFPQIHKGAGKLQQITQISGFH